MESVSDMQRTLWGHKMPKFHPLHSNFQCLSSMSTALSKMASPTTVHVCMYRANAWRWPEQGWMGEECWCDVVTRLYFSWQLFHREILEEMILLSLVLLVTNIKVSFFQKSCYVCTICMNYWKLFVFVS